MQVSAIYFVRDYVQIVLDDIIFTCYTLPRVEDKDDVLVPSSATYEKSLVRLIGRIAQSVEDIQRVRLSIHFEEHMVLSVSLLPGDAACVEAAMLHRLKGQIFDVWRYE